MLHTRHALIALAAALAVLLFAACGGDSDDDAKDTIVFSDLNWSSAQIQNRIAQYIVEKGYDYTTSVG